MKYFGNCNLQTQKLASVFFVVKKAKSGTKVMISTEITITQSQLTNPFYLKQNNVDLKNRNTFSKSWLLFSCFGICICFCIFMYWYLYFMTNIKVTNMKEIQQGNLLCLPRFVFVFDVVHQGVPKNCLFFRFRIRITGSIR